jgi:hypothetical protein
LFEAAKLNVVIWTIGIIIWRCNICYSNKQTVRQRTSYHETVGVALESLNYSNTIVSVAIEGLDIATTIFSVATEGFTYSNQNIYRGNRGLYL